MYFFMWWDQQIFKKRADLTNRQFETNLPRLKNMYRTTTAFLFILNGCPLSMIRFATIRYGSMDNNRPVATSC